MKQYDGTLKQQAAGFTPPPTFNDYNPFEKEVKFSEFPIYSLPLTIQNFVRELSVFTQTPPEMAGVLSLSILAAAVQQRYKLRVRGDWVENLCVFTLAVAAPAERKSAIFRELLAPVYNYQKQHNEENALAIKKNASAYKILTDKITKLEKIAVSKPNEDTLHELEALHIEENEFERVSNLKITIDDSTPEKIVDVAANGNNSLLVASSEGDLIDYVAGGRYENVSGLGVYLKGYDGERIEVDRIKRGTQTVENFLLSILLTIQPQVLSGLMSDIKASGRGLCARFNYAICRGRIGERLTDPPLISETVKTDYHKLIEKLLDHTINTKEPEYLMLSPEADVVRVHYQDDIEKRLKGDFAEMQDWGGKVVGKMLRLAAIFHIIECIDCDVNVSETAIGGKEIIDAITFSEYLIEHAEAAYAQGGADTTTDNAKYLWGRLNSEKEEPIKMSRCLQLVQPKLSAKTISEPLQELEERGYIFIERVGKGRNIYKNPKAD